jgi:hypothetical protein
MVLRDDKLTAGATLCNHEVLEEEGIRTFLYDFELEFANHRQGSEKMWSLLSIELCQADGLANRCL